MGLMLQADSCRAKSRNESRLSKPATRRVGLPLAPSTISAETTYVHSGNYAGLVTNRTDTWNGIAQSFQGVLQTGQTYNISAWLLLAGGSSQTMELTLQKVDGSGTSYTWIASGSVSTNGWIQFSGQYTFNPSGTVTSLNSVCRSAFQNERRLFI